MAEDILTILAEVQRMLTPGSQAAWDLFIRQRIITGVIWSIFWIVILTVCVLVLRGSEHRRRQVLAAYLAEKEEKKQGWTSPSYPSDDIERENWIRYTSLAFIVGALSFALLEIQTLLNPGYYVIKELLGAILGS